MGYFNGTGSEIQGKRAVCGCVYSVLNDGNNLKKYQKFLERLISLSITGHALGEKIIRFPTESTSIAKSKSIPVSNSL